MTALVPLLAASVLLGCAAATAAARSPLSSRRRATFAASVALALSALLTIAEGRGLLPSPGRFGQEIRWLPPGQLRLAPTVTCMVGLLALSMSPVIDGLPRTLSRIALLTAISLAFLATQDPVVLAALWVLSGWVAWRELYRVPAHRRTARLFALYHAPGAALFVAGAGLMAAGCVRLGMSLLVVGIAIREAVLPMHSWFPRFVEDAPLGVVVAFAAPQLGVYAQITLVAEQATRPLGPSVAAAGAVTAVAAAALGLVQRDARRALAYLMISQTGLVAFGLEGGSEVARVGALLTWQVLALAASGFAMTLAALHARRGTLSLREHGGSFSRTPRMGLAFLALGFAMVGFPLTLGFVAEDLLVQGSVAEFPLLGLSLIVATALNGMSVMRCFFALFSGRNTHLGERDLTGRERLALTLAILALLGGGLFPRYWMAPEVGPSGSSVGHPTGKAVAPGAYGPDGS